MATVYLRKESFANEISAYAWSIEREIFDAPDFSFFLQQFTIKRSPSLTFSDTALDSDPLRNDRNTLYLSNKSDDD